MSTEEEKHWETIVDNAQMDWEDRVWKRSNNLAQHKLYLEMRKDNMSTNDKLKTAIVEKPNAGMTASNQPTILKYLETYKSQIAAALPKHLTPDRMVRIVTTEVRKTPELLKCDPTSLFGAVIQCSQLGLEPGNALGHAYLLPFNNRKKDIKEVQLIIGYKGMLDLARRSGQVMSINVFEVYDTDTVFKVSYGLDPKIEHERDIATKTGNLIAVYAVATLKGGAKQFEVMSLNEVNKIRDSSPAANFSSSPWKTHYNEMAKKTVIRRLFKYLPVSIEIQTAVSLDELSEAGISQQNNVALYPNAIDLNISSEDIPDTVNENMLEDENIPA